MDIISFYVISTFCKTSAFCGCYPHFVDVSEFRGYYHIFHITSYLDCNVHHVILSFVMFVDVICIGRILHSFIMVVVRMSYVRTDTQIPKQ